MVDCPAADGSSPRLTSFAEPPPLCIEAGHRYSARIETSLGVLVAALDPITAPRTTNNFVFLARYHFYDGLSFHRVIGSFMCQGGDPAGDGTGGPGYVFADELPRPGRYEVGSLAMANAGPNTNGSQFFIVSGPKGVRLPPQYSLFGKVVKGLDVLAAIEAVPTGPGDRPLDEVRIVAVTIAESAD
jgi:cyclophilin family peptidyl-prolyl cis-trans isomerase